MLGPCLWLVACVLQGTCIHREEPDEGENIPSAVIKVLNDRPSVFGAHRQNSAQLPDRDSNGTTELSHGTSTHDAHSLHNVLSLTLKPQAISDDSQKNKNEDEDSQKNKDKEDNVVHNPVAESRQNVRVHDALHPRHRSRLPVQGKTWGNEHGAVEEERKHSPSQTTRLRKGPRYGVDT